MTSIEIDSDTLNYIVENLTTNIENGINVVYDIFNTIETFDDLCLYLDNIKCKLSLYNFKLLIQANIDSLYTQFDKHLIYLTFKKYNFDKTMLLISKYYNNNQDFLIVPDSNNKTILQLHYYKNIALAHIS